MPEVTIDSHTIDQLLAPYDRSDAPGIALGIALDGQPYYRRGVGMASIELPVVLSPTIRMRIGSTSKHFTALAIMLLAEEGKLVIGDSPRRHIAELPAFTEEITLVQLMSHTSGLRDSLDVTLHSAGPGVGASNDFQLGLMASFDSVNFQPGDSWNYNNGAYALLAEIVERCSGMSFAEFLKERIFKPVGMYDTQVRALDTDLIPNSATLHIPREDGTYLRGVFGLPIGGEGGIVSTVDDMLTWLAHMHRPTVGSRETWDEMRRPLTTHGYGLGLMMDRYRGLSTVHHAGAVVGGSSQMLTVPELKLDIIAMTNGLGSLAVHNLVTDIIDRCVSGLNPKEEDHPADTVSGVYYSAETGRRLSLEDADGKQILRIEGTALPARRDTGGKLSVPLVPSDMQVTVCADAQTLTINEFGKVDILKRIEPSGDSDIDLLIGVFENSGARLTASITSNRDGKLTLNIAGPLGDTDYSLSEIGPDLWEARSDGILPLAVQLERRGTQWDLSTGRTHRLRLTRCMES